MSYSPAPLALDRAKSPPWNVEQGFVDPAYQGLWRGLQYAIFPEGVPNYASNRIRVGRDLTFTPASGQSGNISLAATEHGTAWRFAGNSAHFIGDETQTAGGANAISVAALVRVSGALTRDHRLVAQWQSANRFILWMDADGAGRGYAFIVGTNSGLRRAGEDNADAVQGEWAFIVGTYDGNAEGLRVYKDGLLTGSASGTSTSLTAATSPLRIAGVDTTSDSLEGDLALAAVWDRALSPEEVIRLSADPFGLLRPNWDYVTAEDVDTASLLATGTGTIVDVVNEADNTTDLHLSVDDDPAAPDDDDWVNNAVDVT